MIKEFSTFGSCSSRNIFTTALNKGYKNFFHINFSLESVTLSSLMSKSVEFDSKLINSSHKYDNFCVYHDLTKKEYLDFIKKSDIDYLVLDTYFDVLYGLIIVDKNSFISRSERLMHTDLYDIYENNDYISVENDFEEFMRIWTKYCDLFFKFIEDNCKCKIILNCSRPVYKYYSSQNKGVIESSMLIRKVPIYHTKFRNILDTYILKNYDVNVLSFDNYIADENHVFGLHPTHYEPKYYLDKTNQLTKIINLNETYDYFNKLNMKTRMEERNNLILEFERNRLSEFKYKKTIGFFESVLKYLTARIDIKNEGCKLNKIEILEISDIDASVSFPDWFCDDSGEGLSIHSKSGSINIKIKCFNDGELSILLRGIDSRNDFEKRLPIYIRFTNLMINGEKILYDSMIVSHDNPFKYKMMVQNYEIIEINASWVMY